MADSKSLNPSDVSVTNKETDYPRLTDGRESAVDPGGTNEETVDPGGTNEETVDPGGTNEETVDPGGTNEETVDTGGTNEETVDLGASNMCTCNETANTDDRESTICAKCSRTKAQPILTGEPEDAVMPVRSLSEKEMEEIRTSFSIIDKDGDGKITLEELQSAAYYLGMNPTEEEARAMLTEADLDGDGCIDFEEYTTMMMYNYISIDMERERMITAFRTLDIDGDGFISLDELKMALMFKDPSNLYPGKDDGQLISFLLDADENGDGMIDYVEFVTSRLCSKIF